MEVTIDLEICKIVVRIDKASQYAVFISKLTGETFRLTIPQMIDALRKASELKGKP